MSNETIKKAVTDAENTNAITPVEDNSCFAVTEATGSNKVRFTTTENTATLFNAVMGVSKKIKDIIGKTVDVVNIVITSADVNKTYGDKSENPEKVNKPVCHFFTLDGEHYASISNGIISAVKGLFEIGVIPTVESPLSLRFIEGEGKNGKFHSFELME